MFEIIVYADQQIKAAGIPIHGIDGGTANPHVNYQDHATPEQRAQGNQILANVLADPAAAQAAWESEQPQNLSAVVDLLAEKL